MQTHLITFGIAVLTSLSISCDPTEWFKVPLGEFENPDAPFSRIRYAELKLVSLNDRCPVTGSRLNPTIKPVYVNGRPIGFC